MLQTSLILYTSVRQNVYDEIRRTAVFPCHDFPVVKIFENSDTRGLAVVETRHAEKSGYQCQ